MTCPSFAALARAEADRRKLSAPDLARLAGTDPVTVHLVFGGYDVRLSSALKVAAALGLPTGVLGTAGSLR